MAFDDQKRKNNKGVSSSTRKLGACGETLAVNYLESQGHQILHRNLHCRFTELDIISMKDGVLCFVEVKYRKNLSFGHPLESISPLKIGRLKKGISWYLATYGDIGQNGIRLLFLSVLGEENPEFLIVPYE